MILVGGLIVVALDDRFCASGAIFCSFGVGWSESIPVWACVELMMFYERKVVGLRIYLSRTLTGNGAM